jgi:hypothetical protein
MVITSEAATTDRTEPTQIFFFFFNSSSRLKTRYHLNEFSSRNRPQNAEELFNLRHSSPRVTIERAFAALKNRFKILDQKPFHTFPTQVKLVLACCILHNWILGWGEDEYVPDVDDVTPDGDDCGHGVEQGDIQAWKNKRNAWAQAMWAHRTDVFYG